MKRIAWSLALLSSPAHTAIMLTVPAEPLTASPPPAPVLELDLDNNGVLDLMIPGSSRQIDVIPQGDNLVLSFDQFGTIYAADLAAGSFIGATPGTGMLWASDTPIMSGCFSGGGGTSCGGNFLGGIEYLGVEFEIDGATHYGWVEVESREFFHFVRVHRWAYESEPGAPIRAGQIPEPSGLVLVLAGVLLGWPRTRRANCIGCRTSRDTPTAARLDAANP